MIASVNSMLFKIKISIILSLFVLLVFSFFFTPTIEKALDLDFTYGSRETSLNEFSESDFKVTFIDVGQGNCVFIRFPDGKVMLIDGGDVDAGRKVESVLRADGVNKIDYLVASHSDADHIGGLVYLLEKFDVYKIFRPFQFAGSDDETGEFVPHEDEDLSDFYYYIKKHEENPKLSLTTSKIYRNFISAVYNEFYELDGVYRKSEVCIFYDGLTITGDDYKVEFFSPLIRSGDYNLLDYSHTEGYATVGYGSGNSNENSAIMMINIHNYKFFFSGDASWTSNLYDKDGSAGHAEIDFLDSLTESEMQEIRGVSVFLMGHHGSSYSSGERLLQLLQPEFCVVSAGKENYYGHPDSDALARALFYLSDMENLLFTCDLGTITFGDTHGKLMYSSESHADEVSYGLSYPALAVTAFCALTLTIVSIRGRRIYREIS